MPPSAILFVPRTKEVKLADLLREKELELSKTLKQKVKIVERSGTRLEHLLCKSDPWGDLDCGRDNCLILTHVKTLTRDPAVGPPTSCTR